MMHLCKLQDILVWNGPFEPDCFDFNMKSVGTESSTQSFCCCLQRARDVDFLLMAKLVAISTLGNPPRLGEQHCFFRWSQVVLSEGHHFCCNRQEAVCLNDVRSGNKAGFDRP